MAKPEIVVLIPESTRKARGGSSEAPEIDSIASALPAAIRAKLEGLREEVLHKSPKGSVRPGGLLPAYRRFQGNMYMSIPEEAWAHRAPNVEIVIASGLRGLVASRDTVPAYALSMAEPTPPFGKLNRWWHERGLPESSPPISTRFIPASSSTSFPWSTGSRSWGTPPASRGSTFGRSIFPGWAVQASPFAGNASPEFCNPERRSPSG